MTETETISYIYRGFDQPGFFAAGAQAHLRLSADNKRPTNHYLCIVPLLDESRMQYEFCQANHCLHLEDIFNETEIVDDLREGRCRLVIDICNEGPVFNHVTYDSLHSSLDRRGIPRSSAFWVTQNRKVPEDYKSSFGRGLNFLIYDYYVHAQLIQFASDYSTAIGFNLDAFIQAQSRNWQRANTFLCLNAEPRAHRVLTVAALKKELLFENSITSFGGLSRSKTPPEIMRRAAHQFMASFPALNIYSERFDEAIQHDPIRPTTLKGNDLAFNIDINDYLSTFFSIVTETDFSDGSVERITEKSVKAACLGHSLYIVGNPGSLRLLAELGFILKSDSSYDGIAAPDERFLLLIEAIKKEVLSCTSTPEAWIAARAESIRTNVLLAAGGDALASYERLYLKPSVARLARMADKD